MDTFYDEHLSALETIDALKDRIKELEDNLNALQTKYEELEDDQHELLQDNASLDAELCSCRQHVAELEAERRWIPISERLPDIYSNVFTYSGTADYQGTRRVLYYGKDKWYDEQGEFITHPNITYWMLLPELPEEVE